MATAILHSRFPRSTNVKQVVRTLPPLNYTLKRPAFRRDRLQPVPIEIPDVPWPNLFDPPQAPYAPGCWPEPARLVWEQWSDSWDDCAGGLELEAAGLIFATYDDLVRQGFMFDPRFAKHLDRWRQHLADTLDLDNEDSFDQEVDHADSDRDDR